MTVEFNHEAVMKEFEKKQKKFLTKTGLMGVVLASQNLGKDGREHVDTGASRNAKQYQFTAKDKIEIQAPLDYDGDLENRYGILAITKDKLIPYMLKFEGEAFG